MPRKSKKTRSKRGLLIFAAPLLALTLALIWIWKANKVKEYYSVMKSLEEKKKELIFENSRSGTELAELKSLTSVDKAATGRLKLTQKVSARYFLEDPVRASGASRGFDLVNMDKVTDWLEGEVVGSGKAMAQPDKEK